MLLVVLYHAGFPGLPGGYIGVDVFFVVSGYVITGLLYRELCATSRIDLAAFYGRRMRRLLPAAALVLAVTFAAFWLLYSPLERQRLGAVSLATALYVSNVWFALYATDYLGGDASSNPLLHTWSLAVEEQFYLVWPFALLAFGRCARRFDLRTRLALGIAVVCVASFAGAVIAVRVSQPWAFFGSPTRAWEFGAGALVYFGCTTGSSVSAPWRTALAGVGMMLLIGSAALLNEDSLMPGFVALACVGGTAAIMLMGKPGDRGVYRLLAATPMVRLGDISYGWYLWHWPVLVIIKEIWPAPPWFLNALGLAVSLMLAAAMYRAFENPIRHNAFLSSRPAASIALGAAITFVCSSVAYVERDRAQASALAADQVAIQRAQMDVPQILQRSGCHADILQTRVPADCRFGTRDSSVTIALFGDSHAEHWFPTLEKIAADRGWSLLSLTKSGCPSISIEPYLHSLRRSYRECTEWRDKALRAIIDSKPRLVVMANSYAYERFEYEGVSRAEAWARGLDRALREFAQARIDVLLLRDTPVAPFDVPTCLSRAAARDDPSGARCRFDRSYNSNPEIFAAESRIATTRRGVRVADLTTAVCPEPLCAVVRNATPIYSDRSHMTTAFAAALAPALYDHVVQEVQSDSASTPSTRN